MIKYYKDCKYLEHMNAEDDLSVHAVSKSTFVIYNHFCDIQKFCNTDVNQFIWIQGKYIYPHEYMNDQKNYKYPKRGWEDLGTIILGEYHDFNVQNGTLLQSDVFENFRKNALKYKDLVLRFCFFCQD